MGKIIITEDEKLRILNLYEQGNFGQTNKNEYQVVDKRNPFKYDDLIKARKTYSTLWKNENHAYKDGDFYYVFNLDDSQKFLDDIAKGFYTSLLSNKKLKGQNGETLTVTDVHPKVYVPGFIDRNKLSIILNINFYENDSGTRVVLDFSEKRVENFPVSDLAKSFNKQISDLTKTKTQSDDDTYRDFVYLSKKELNYLLQNPPKINRTQIPDDLFQIRQINLSKSRHPQNKSSSVPPTLNT